MAQNTKDPRQRTPEGENARPEKPGSGSSSPEHGAGRQGVGNPNKHPDPGGGLDEGRQGIASPGKPSRTDEDGDRQGVGRRSPGGGKDSTNDGVVDLDDIDTDEQPTQRLDRQ